MRTYTRHSPIRRLRQPPAKTLWEMFFRRKILVVFSLVLLVILPIALMTLQYASSSEAAWYDAGWSHRKQLFFNNANQSTALVNFPVLVTLSASNFDFTQAKGAGEDIRFTDSDGSTLLAYEIELYSQASQSARMWVNVPQIDANSTTDSIFLYWGNNEATDAQNSDSTWNSNYKGVYHLGDNAASTTVIDSSGLANHITASENTNNGFSQTGKIGNSFLTAGTPTYITKQDGQSLSEVYADIVLDSSGYPVIAYTDYTNFDLILVHCNDKECKGNNESISVVDSANSTGLHPSLQLDGNGYPMIAYQYATGLDLKYVHCNDARCSGGDETFSTIETTNNTGYYPRMVKDGNGYPVIAYYYGTGADLKLVHCGDIDCSSGNQINSIDTTGAVGNGYLGSDLVLDSNGYPVITYYDTTNTELKIAHCNDANCSGGDESLTSPLSTLAKSLGSYSTLKLDDSGNPMVAYLNTTDTNLEYIHCDDINCSGDESPSLKVLDVNTTDFIRSQKNTSGFPIIVARSGQNYPRVYICSDTNCTTNTPSYLSLYNQYNGAVSSFTIDSNSTLYITSYSRGKTNQYDTILYTTHHKLERAYDSDFDFGTGNFSLSAWVKSSGMIQQNAIVSRYDADQGFKLYQNYAGQTCFGIDDDVTWGPDDSVCSSNPQLTTNVDNGNATNINTGIDMALDSNNYPVIAYYDYAAAQLNLELIRCNDVSCSGNDESFVALDTTGDVGSSLSIILDSNSYPVVSYYDATNTALKIVHCGNANCSSGNTINTIDDNGNVGSFSTIRLDSNGYPVITYYDTTNTAVKLVHCNDVHCSGANESIVTLVNTEDDRVRQGSKSLQLDGNGYPMVVFYDATNGDLEFVHCNDVNCDGIGETFSTIDASGTVGDFASFILDSSGYPMIAYHDTSNFKLKVTHCGNADCSSGNSTNTVNVPNSGDGGYSNISMGLNESGYPIILSSQLASWSNYLTVCNDVNCSGNDELSYFIRAGSIISNNGHRMVLDSNNYPVIAMAVNWNDLYLLRLTSPSYAESGNQDDQNWHHLVAVKNNTSSITLYIDGAAVATDSALAATGTLTSNSAPFNLAEEIQNNLSVNNWTGYLDEVQIDTTARSSDWVRAQYLSESNAFITSGGTQNGPTANSMGTYSGTNRLKDHLVAHYKFDEGYGTNANNSGSGGNAKNGVFDSSAPDWNTNGKYNKALSFTSANSDHVDVGDLLSGDYTRLSVSAWINPTTLNTGWIGGEGGAFRFGLTSAGNLTCWHRGWNISNADVNDSSSTTTSPISVGNWYYVVCTWDGVTGMRKLYINGQEIVSDTSSVATTKDSIDSNNATIGDGYNNLGQYFNGLIDEIKMYDIALTLDEVKQDYNHGSALSLGSLSDTSGLGGSVASTSASAQYCVPGSSDPCSPPIGEWNFEEGSGAVAHDESGNNNAGILTGTTWSVGKRGKALAFNGNTDVMRLTGEGSRLSTSTYTINSWVNIATTGVNHFIFDNRDSVSDGYIFYISTANVLACKHNATTISGLTELATNHWYYISCAFDGTTVRLYVNGVLDNSGSVTGTISETTDAAVGGRNFSTLANVFSGKIDAVSLYSYARTPAQIAWDYDKGKPIAHWKFDECQGTAANDSSGNNNVGTITIGATGTNTTSGTCTTSGAWYDGATGKLNSAMSFDGTDDHIVFDDVFDTTFSSDFSSSFWFKINSIPSDWVRYVIFKGSGTLPYYAVGINGSSDTNNQGKIAIRHNNDIQLGLSTKTYADNLWHHVTITRNDNLDKVKLYVDGDLDKTFGDITYTNTGNFYIGSSGSTRYFPGQIDDVRIYNYALTPQQVKTVYNNGTVYFGPITGSP